MMQENDNMFVNTCNFMGVSPIMMELPYPPIQVREKNRMYANILSFDYCGPVSEMSAITQYITDESRLSREKCAVAKTILGIAMAEMIHLQKLGELIVLLGGNVDFIARQNNGKRLMWTPEYLKSPENTRSILQSGIEDEQAAINQYKMHIRNIQDEYVGAVLARIIQDEEYHIMLLRALME